MHDASVEENIAIVQPLLDESADVNERNADHETLLDVASTEGKLEVLTQMSREVA